MKLKQFKHELRGNYKCDKWGEVMGAWFDCADHLTYKDGATPAHWQYKPGLGGPHLDKESYWYSIFKRCSPEQLVTIGNYLERLSRFLDRAGLSY